MTIEIDLRLATVEWLQERKASETLRSSFSKFRNIPDNLASAQEAYVSDKMDIYIQRCNVYTNEVILTITGSLDRDDLQVLMDTQYILPSGKVVVLKGFDTAEFYYPYDETPSRAIEVTFS